MKLAAIAWFVVCAAAQTDRYAGPVYQTITSGNLASVSVAVIVGGEIKYVFAKGYANRWAGVRATPETLYPLGGITQTFTAASLAAMASSGKIRLDDRVEKYLGGVRIRGQETGSPVTVRHVLAHTSGLIDSREPLGMHSGAIPAQPPPLLFSSVLVTAARPETEARYSSVAYGALGLMLTSLSGQTVPEYFREKWMLPLGMRETGFSLAGPLQERLAMGYNRPAEGDPVALQMFGHSPDSPLLTADGLAGTARDLAQWLLLHLNRGRFNGRELLPEQAVKEICRLQYPALRGPRSLPETAEAGWGLGWLVWPCEGGQCIGHTGSARGYTAMVSGNPERKTGVVVLTNSDGARADIAKLSKELLRLADSETSGNGPVTSARLRKPRIPQRTI